MTWRVIVPVKGTSAAKSRLAPVVGRRREEFARALASDTLIAAAGTQGVELLVVTNDPAITARARELGAQVVADSEAGLCAALAAGVEAALARKGRDDSDDGPSHRADRGVAILLGDLPALRPQDLAAALEACGRFESAFVPDAEGSGTVLLTAREPSTLIPRFGPGSAAAHGRSATRLDLDLPRLRQDVDVADDLTSVLALGVGRHTAALLATFYDEPPASERSAPKPADESDEGGQPGG